MKVVHYPNQRPIKMWTECVQVEPLAMQQLCNIASLPFIHHHVAVMPDVHWGIGATVGSVIATEGAIIPSAVGVDIGCGMIAQRLGLKASDLPDNLHSIRCAIEEVVPHGRTHDGGVDDAGAFAVPMHTQPPVMHQMLQRIVERHPQLHKASLRAPYHLGTLGTGNHFIEICLDENQDVWIMLHSGSRGIGNAIGRYFIELAKKEMRRWYINLPDADLAYLVEGTEHYEDYRTAVAWAQAFAQANREAMMRATMFAMQDQLGMNLAVTETAINCHHNYVNDERHFRTKVHVTRKGAVSARRGELGIIPGSMGDRSYIVRGKGNLDSFHSCSHGAGRIMSRNEARAKFTLENHIRATEGVECRKDEGVIDETPAAYKPIDLVMAAQADLVEVVHTLKQVICVKG